MIALADLVTELLTHCCYILASLQQRVKTLLKYQFLRNCCNVWLCFTVQDESNFEDCGNDGQDRKKDGNCS